MWKAEGLGGWQVMSPGRTESEEGTENRVPLIDACALAVPRKRGVVDMGQKPKVGKLREPSRPA